MQNLAIFNNQPIYDTYGSDEEQNSDFQDNDEESVFKVNYDSFQHMTIGLGNIPLLSRSTSSCSSNEPIFDEYLDDKEKISTSVYIEIFSINHVYDRYESEEGEDVKLISVVENEKESYLLHSYYNQKVQKKKVNQGSGLTNHNFSSLESALSSFDLLILRA